MNHTKKRRSRPAVSKRRNDRASEINPDLLVKKGTSKPKAVKAPPAWSYESTNLHPTIKRNVERLGYTHPTPIQEQSIQPAIKGRDILGIAGTGTGKTAAFLIPVIQRLLLNPDRTRTLIVVPTRELALQVSEEFDNLSRGTKLKSSCFIGGRSVSADISRLRQRNHIVIGTPGRLMDLYKQRALDLSAFTTFVLDEFDRMLDMGFLPDIQRLLTGLTNRQQTLFFSATIDKKQRKLIDTLLNDPVRVTIEQENKAADTVEQEVIRVTAGRNKFDMFHELISEAEFSKVLVFAETKRVVNQLSKKLTQKGIRSDVIHGNKSQNYRQNALKRFSAGKLQVLVATDVAARGLDVSDVSHVINYQLPQTMDSYIHRIGRTGRAGKQGYAYTFVD